MNFKSKVERRDQCCLCGKTQKQVRMLLVGLRGAVCSDCIDLCGDILANEATKQEGTLSGAVASPNPSPIREEYTKSRADQVKVQFEAEFAGFSPEEWASRWEGLELALQTIIERLESLEKRI